MGQYSFQEVMRQWGRLCSWHCKRNADDCEGCILGETHADACASYAQDNAKNRETIESTVMQWAAEHPEPVYETWFEYLLRIGVIPEDAPAGGEYQWIVESIKHKHISNDIAESLKLHPKEVQA